MLSPTIHRVLIVAPPKQIKKINKTMFKIKLSCGMVFSSPESIRKARQDFIEYHIEQEIEEPKKIAKVIDGEELDEENLQIFEEDLAQDLIDRREEKPEDFGVDLEEEMRISSDEAFRIGRDC